MQTNVWIIQSKQPDKFTARIKKGLKACLQWKVHLAYPASLQALHSNTKKQLFGLQVRRADHLAMLPALIVSTILCCEAKVCNNCKLKLLFFRTAVFFENFPTLDSHANTVICHVVAYPSRWLPNHDKLVYSVRQFEN